MKHKHLRHITALVLSWIMVIHAVLVLVPEQEKVLCLAEDHIAIEVPVVWVNAGATAATGHLMFFHDYHTPTGDTCVDIPLETRTLVTSSGHLDLLPVFSFPAIDDIFSSYTAKEHSSLFQEYPPGSLSAPFERYAARSRVLLI